MNSSKPELGRILIVENEAILALDLRSQLEGLGLEVVGIADSGEQALELARRERPDLVLMDIRLDSEMSGCEAAHILRKELDLPSIFLTGYTDHNTVQECKASQPLGFLVKPLDQRMLGITLEIALNHEATRRKQQRAQSARARAESRYFAILDNSTDGVVTTDADEKIVVFSRGAERCFQYTAEQVVGKPLAKLLPELEIAEHSPRVQNFIRSSKGERVTGPMRAVTARRKDGSFFPAEITVSRHYEGEQPFITAIVRDITERRGLEEEYAHSQRLEAVGRLGASVAHEFNNLLQAISAFQFLLPGSTPGETEELMKGCSEVVERGAALSRQLLDLSRRQADALMTLTLSELLSSTVTMATRLLGRQIEVTSDVALSSEVARLPQGQFEQVMLNLIINARDAMPEGGSLHFAALPHPDLKAHVLVTVSDTGTGIASKELRRVFDPFFTTKPAGMGTGLGLAQSRRLVEGWEGTISVASELNVGTTFGLTIPSADAIPSHLTAQPVKRHECLSGTEALLLIEPDPYAGEFLHRVLVRHGYSVTTAHTLAEARAPEFRSQDPALIICSSVVSRTSAQDLLKLAIDLPARPQLLMLSASGVPELPLSGQFELLHKPFCPAELLQIVRKLLDAAN